MIHQAILVNGEWREASFPVSSYKAVSPINNRQLNDSFPVSSFLDLDQMLQAQEAKKSAIDSVTVVQRSELLHLISNSIREQSKKLVSTAHEETGLSEEWLEINELPLMLRQLSEAGDFCRNEDWQIVGADEACDLISIRVPFSGPVVIFGPASSPFLLNSCGGRDFSCAVAAGNSIIAKANPNHPKTCQLLAEIIADCINKLKLPECLFQFFYGTTADLGYRLVSHPMTGALSFTGSQRNGMALKENTDRSNKPVFFNSAGFNPVFILKESAKINKDSISEYLCEAILKNNGQSCKKPGTVFLIEDKDSSQLVRSITEKFNSRAAGPLVTDLMARNLDTIVNRLIRLGARKLTRKEFYQPTPFIYPNTILCADHKTYLKSTAQFTEEMPGPVLTFVTLENESQMAQIAKNLDMSSCINIFAESGSSDDAHATDIFRILTRKACCVNFNPFLNNEESENNGCGAHPYLLCINTDFSGYHMSDAIKKFCRTQSYKRLPKNLRPQSFNP